MGLVDQIAGRLRRRSGSEAPAVCGRPSTGSVQSKTVVIRWREISDHERVVRVVADFDPANRDLANGLAELDDDGFLCLDRDCIEVEDVADDSEAEFFDPPGYPER